MLISIGSPASPGGALQLRIGPVPAIYFASIGIPGEVTGAWATATFQASLTAAKVGSATSTPTVHAGTRTAKVASAWSTPTVHSAWEVVA